MAEKDTCAGVGGEMVQIGTFTAASNVSGLCVDTDAITGLLHRYGALSFWDYATAAPYISVDMNPVGGFGDASLEKDAIFISGHKFVGGPGTPGVLVVKRRLLKNEVRVKRRPIDCTHIREVHSLNG